MVFLYVEFSFMSSCSDNVFIHVSPELTRADLKLTFSSHGGLYTDCMLRWFCMSGNKFCFL